MSGDDKDGLGEDRVPELKPQGTRDLRERDLLVSEESLETLSPWRRRTGEIDFTWETIKDGGINQSNKSTVYRGWTLQYTLLTILETS